MVSTGVPRRRPSRYNGIIHDFVMLNARRDTHGAPAATAPGGDFLRGLLRDVMS
jgi:hypothetical protein